MKTFSLVLLLFFTSLKVFPQQPIPNEERLKWWQDAKLGLFVHWGPVSLIGEEISWSRAGYGKNKYDSLYLQFNPRQFNAKEWVALAKAGGMKYIVLTAKHHDGFCLFDTKTTDYNIMNTPFRRDVCKELADAAHEAGMPICWYFSVADWKDPDCRNSATNEVFNKRLLEQVTELLTNYGKISLLWIDYEGSPSPIQPKRVYDLARKLQPEIIINNRLEPFTPDESHSRVGPYSDYATPEGFVAGYGAIPWETCTNMGHQWAWKFNDTPRSLKESVHTLLRCVGGNGNLLFNIGPDSTGVFPKKFVDRATEMGNWVAKNSEAIYQTKGGVYTPAKDYVCSYNGNKVYLHLLTNRDEKITLPPMTVKIIKATLSNGKAILVNQQKNSVALTVPLSDRDSIATIVTITLNKPATTIAQIIPFTSTSSLAYGKQAKASSSVGQFLHDPTAAFDDNLNTYWKMGRRTDVDFDKLYGESLDFMSEASYNLFQNKGWLTIDLKKPQKISKIKLNEAVYRDSKIKQFEVQYEKAGQWIRIAKEDKMGNWEKQINPIVAKKFRLVILDSYGYVGIKEFQLF